MESGVAPPLLPPETGNRSVQIRWVLEFNPDHITSSSPPAHLSRQDEKKYGQAARPISTGQLHALLRFHLQPINLLV
jgi:hypothetical protein